MRTSKILIAAALAAVAVAGALAATGRLPIVGKPTLQGEQTAKAPTPIAVTAARAKISDFTASVLVTGSLVPREEILIGPEVEGLRIIEVLADEGDRVKKGQVLARLVSDTLEAQLAQNEASLARATAAIAQARSNIASVEARLVEARNNYNRGKPLSKSGYISESGMDQREATAKTAEAAVAAARDGLKVAEAEKAQIEAQRREIAWRRGRTDIASPADGIISRRVARIGGFAAGVSDSMFRVIAKGEIELDAELPETQIARIKVGQSVAVMAAGTETAVQGKVRLVSPEVDKATRLGRVRIFLGDERALRIGSFARGTIETAKSHGIAVPASAILYTPEGASVQVVNEGTIRTRRVKLGLEQAGFVEVRDGLANGEVVVAKAGTFLRDGDTVRAVFSETQGGNSSSSTNVNGKSRQTANANE